MEPFRYVRVSDEPSALDAVAKGGAVMLAGGTNLIDLMRLGITKPSTLVDVNHLPLAAIEEKEDGLSIGAMARNNDVAYHPVVRRRYPVLSEALLSGASPQLRNLATVGGNLLQRTRCAYFRDAANPSCNKRKMGSGCAAMNGWTRMHAVLGTSDRCIAAHPSDMSVALVALDATVHVRGAGGARQIAIADFHTVPGQRPDIESVLTPGELITHVSLPATPFAARSRYVKARDRSGYAFALASAAAALELDGSIVKQARVALGGATTKPWRCIEAERKLVGEKVSPAVFRAAAEAAMQGATPRNDNAFKVELARRVIARALALAAGMA
jgi:xanthine dehydrogenase YagS FAD-binding subunit